MPDQRSPEELLRDPCEAERQIDAAVLALMLNDESWPWSMDEIARELDGRIEAVDAIRRLSDHGLIHRCGAERARLPAPTRGYWLPPVVSGRVIVPPGPSLPRGWWGFAPSAT